jgi:hypothetical protein
MHAWCLVLLQGQYRRAHEVKLSTDALYESELAATHQAWELVVELKQNKLVSKQQGEDPLTELCGSEPCMQRSGGVPVQTATTRCCV